MTAVGNNGCFSAEQRTRHQPWQNASCSGLCLKRRQMRSISPTPQEIENLTLTARNSLKIAHMFCFVCEGGFQTPNNIGTVWTSPHSRGEDFLSASVFLQNGDYLNLPSVSMLLSLILIAGPYLKGFFKVGSIFHHLEASWIFAFSLQTHCPICVWSRF